MAGQGRARQGEASERTFGLAVACSVGFATIAATTTTTTTTTGRSLRESGASGRASSQAGRDRDDARGWAWICGLSMVEVVEEVSGQSACSSRAQELVKEETDKARRSIYSKGPEKSRIDDRLRNTTKTRDERILNGGELQLEALDGRPEHSVKPNTIIPLVIRTASLCSSLHPPHGSVYVSRGVAAVATLQWRDLLNSLRHRD